MLDNLVNADLSGLTGHINYSYDSISIAMPSIIIAVISSVMFLLIGIGLYTLFTGTKSSRYKHFMTDMWVVGKVKQLAEKDKVDLEKEIKYFITMDKKNRIYEKSIASVIEQEMKEKISDEKLDVKDKK